MKSIMIWMLGFFLTTQSFVKADVQCAQAEWVNDYVKTIPDFPSQGFTFKWYSPLLKDPAAFKRVIQIFADRYRNTGIDAIVGLDSRGFIWGSALAYELDVPFVVVRKAGKLPGEVISVKYDLEYGKDCFEIEKGILSADQKVLIIDDVVATGGTVNAAGKLIEQLGAQVHEVACFIEISVLKGRENIPYPVFSVIDTKGT